MKMAKMMGDTSEVIKQMNSLMNVKELSGTMKEMQKQMMQVTSSKLSVLTDMLILLVQPYERDGRRRNGSYG